MRRTPAARPSPSTYPTTKRCSSKKGTRRLELENAIRAKFDKIMVPIADALVADDQLSHVGFDAFFQNTMFHEVAHGLGIKNTIDGKGTVRTALKENASALEEEKADVVGLYMVKQLYDRGELTGGSIEDNYTTFLAGLFRSVRFGAADAHGKANMITFNFFRDRGAFARDDATGKYRVDYAAMGDAVNALAARHPAAPGRRRLRRRHPAHGREGRGAGGPPGRAGEARRPGHPAGHRLRAGRSVLFGG